MRVLVADDNAVSRRVLEGMLRKWDYEVVAVSDGAQAWEALQSKSSPHLAVLDWMMPGLTGPEICRLVRKDQREPYIYILLLTSRSLKADLIEGMSAGADDYIIKPFDQHELNVRLRAGRRIVELQGELLAAREALREQATHDPLTWIWNRASILEILERELARGFRERAPVGVVMADLDHFKSVNDNHGHAAGDAVLKEACRRMQAVMRPYDALGRYGGEEFLIVLPGCDAAATAAHAERMRAALSGEPVPLREKAISITASLGATAAAAGSRAHAETVLRLADDALYESKRYGRNRVTVHSGPADIPTESGAPEAALTSYP